MTPRWWMAFVPIVIAGCASGGSSGATADALPPCQVETDESRDWRQVTTAEVSFCVPAGWSSGGRNEWRARGGSIRWGTGPTRQVREVGQTIALVRPGEIPQAPPPSAPVTRLSEVIGGLPVELSIFQTESQFQTSAVWRTPGDFSMGGTATSQSAAELQLDIFRTARPTGSER
jgi:hypothetical protein